MRMSQLMDNNISQRLLLYVTLGLSLILLVILVNVQSLVDVIPRSKSPEIFTVRLQVQGKSLQNQLLSHVIERNAPITALEVSQQLLILQTILPKQDYKLTDIAFVKAEKWVWNVAQGGGIGPIGSRTFVKPGTNPSDARVDIEILRGSINLVP